MRERSAWKAQPGEGTTFYCRFPHDQEGSQCLRPLSSPSHVDDSHASPAGSILIIDDEAEIRESLQTLLEFEGYDGGVTAGTGEEGLTRSGRVRLIWCCSIWLCLTAMAWICWRNSDA